MRYFNWQKAGEPQPPYTRLSPNLRLILTAMIAVFGGFQNGGYNKRPIRGGTSWSDHAFGAAFDWNYGPNRQGALAAIDWLIAHHKKLGVQVIHDYLGARLWRVGEGWRPQAPGSHDGFMGAAWATWLHVGTPPEFWDTTTPLADRGVPLGAVPVPEERPSIEGYRLGVPVPPLSYGAVGHGVTQLIDVLKFWRWYPAPYLHDINDGRYGDRTRAGVTAMQVELGVPADGEYGKRTASAYGGWLDALKQLLEPPTPPEAPIYTAVPGDSMWTIAKMHGITLDQLAIANRLPAPSDRVMPGDQFAIYGRSVKVIEGDGWISVAKAIDVDKAALQRVNGNSTDASMIHPNTFLLDPRGIW